VTQGLVAAPVAFLAAPSGTDNAALTHTWQAVIARGGQPVLVSTSRRDVELCRQHDGTGSGRPRSRRVGAARVDIHVADAAATDFCGLVLPGGLANADQLRANPAAVQFARGFFAAGLPVAAICRAPWVLTEAGVVPGRQLTSWPGIRTDLRNAGATWLDDHVVVCDQGPNVLVTGQDASDLPVFCQWFTRAFAGPG
jgi:protease I